jgi:hypothetical protein
VIKLHIEDPGLNTEVTRVGSTSQQEWDIAGSYWIDCRCSCSQWRSSDGLLETISAVNSEIQREPWHSFSFLFFPHFSEERGSVAFQISFAVS